MAVGTLEIEALIAGGKDEVTVGNFALLDNEADQLTLYITELRLRRDVANRCPALTVARPPQPGEDAVETADARYAVMRSPLPEYIRRTHAWRSGARLLKRWKEHPYLAEAAASVCIGHWLDLSKVDTQMPFAAPRALFDSTPPPNLRAVAVAVRLADLFDVGIDRTPFALWDYIRPRDRGSVLEWQKHRCLAPVTVRHDDHGKCAPVFAGDVKDHEVCAALQDLHRYAEEQLRGCCDLMRRHHHADKVQRHSDLPWRLRPEVILELKPKGFVPCNIRFEFDRSRVLEMLATSLYGGDTHVFLRELLQNAIDASRLRRARQALEKGSRPPEGIIHFTVQHGTDGDATVICCDHGIGMDEQTVRNYLAKVGTSYWQSDQFRSLEAGFSPIGEFGIGLLSCFSVADEVEILTRRYDFPDPRTPALRIRIPSASRHFRVEHADVATPYGTIVTVKVRGEKLREQWRLRHAEEAAQISPEKHPAPPLEVTNYLRCIAGFVRFPIVIDENGERTVIVHPDHETLSETAEDNDILFKLEQQAMHTNGVLRWAGAHRLKREYPWHYLQFSTYTPLLSHRIVDLRRDLAPELHSTNYEGIEGWLAYPMPADVNSEFTEAYEGIHVSSPFHGESQMHINFSNRGLFPDEAPSARWSWEVMVYRDGILLPNSKEPERPKIWGTAGINQQLIINFPGAVGFRLEPSRTQFLGWSSNWADFLWEAVKRWLIRSNEITRILDVRESDTQENLCSLFFQLGRLGQLFGLSYQWLAAQIPSRKFPVPWLDPSGSCHLLPIEPDKCDVLWESPDPDVFRPRWALSPLRAGTRLKLRKDSLLENSVSWVPSLRTTEWDSASKAWLVSAHVVGIGKILRTVRWLVPPEPGDVPVVQYGWQIEKMKEPGSFHAIGARLARQPHKVSPEEWMTFWDAVKELCAINVNMSLIRFEPPYEDRFTISGRQINSNSPLAQWLLRLLSALIGAQRKNALCLVNSEWRTLLFNLFDSLWNYNQRGLKPILDHWYNIVEYKGGAGIWSPTPPPRPLSRFDFLSSTYDPLFKGEYAVSRASFLRPRQKWGCRLPKDWTSSSIRKRKNSITDSPFWNEVTPATVSAPSSRIPP
jgi:hypothetical protein